MPEMILAKPSQLPHYRNIPLYTKTGEKSFALYKRAGMLLSDMRMGEGLHPAELYLDQEDRLQGIKDVQQAFNRQLRHSLSQGGKPDEIKGLLVGILEETFSHPRSGSLEGVAETLDILVEGSGVNADLMINLARVSHIDYTTAIHSINMMAFTTAFCLDQGFSQEQTRKLGLSAMLHDVGKAEMPPKILQAPRQLTNEEFMVMKSHTSKGVRMIRACGYTDPEVLAGAEEHHEKLDGSGYPSHKTKLSFAGRLLGIIDCYEALTSDERPYRRAAKPIEALQILKDEAQQAKYDWELFTKFAYTLT